jgi:6-phosphogluconolactonase
MLDSAAVEARHDFSNRADLARALADRVASRLSEAIAQRGRGLIAVSGGSTPALFFHELSGRDIDWSKVTVTLIDERFVDPESPRSNAGLVLRNLLTDRAAAAKFVPLYRTAPDVEAAADAAEKDLRMLPLPLDVAVLGMGADGHTASFFPDAKNLADLIDPIGSRVVLPVHAESGIEPRLTLTLPVIAAAGLLILHIEGAEKQQVLERALEGDRKLPIAAVLRGARTPVQVYWAP